MDAELARAKEIAVKFFEQYQSPVTARSVILDDKTCIVRVDAGLVRVKTFDVSVDSVTGKIISYNPVG